MSIIHQLIRLPLKLIPKGWAIPILSGPLRGAKWIKGAGTNGCWIGTYEKDRQIRLLEVLNKGDCFLDIGANVGFYTLLAARLVGENGSVHSFEPVPENQAYIQKHISLNRVKNISLHFFALSDGVSRTMKFSRSTNASSGHLDEDQMEGEYIVVQVSSLDTLWEADSFARPAVLKIDVEGAEYDVLSGGEKMILECHPVILFAGHGTAVQERCTELLSGYGYRLQIDRDGSLDGMYETTAWPNERASTSTSTSKRVTH